MTLPPLLLLLLLLAGPLLGAEVSVPTPDDGTESHLLLADMRCTSPAAAAAASSPNVDSSSKLYDTDPSVFAWLLFNMKGEPGLLLLGLLPAPLSRTIAASAIGTSHLLTTSSGIGPAAAAAAEPPWPGGSSCAMASTAVALLGLSWCCFRRLLRDDVSDVLVMWLLIQSAPPNMTCTGAASPTRHTPCTPAPGTCTLQARNNQHAFVCMSRRLSEDVV
jgi:hypothetical protein